MGRRAGPLAFALLLASSLHCPTASAAEFSISPLRMQFAPGARSAAVSIHNEDRRPIRFQISLVEWTQDAKGNDVYTPSNDLVFFPRQLTVAPGERAVARVGPKRPQAGPEKTYRLRVEELPEPLDGTPGMAIGLSIVFALPVFLGVADAMPQAQIEPLQMQNGKLKAVVRNTGRSQFRIDSLAVRGANGYAQQMAGWYLLAGASREHLLDIPAADCRALQHLDLEVKVDQHTFTSPLEMDPRMCGT